MIEDVLATLRHPFELFFDPTNRLSLLHLGTALAAAVFIFFRTRNMRHRRNLKGLLNWLLPWDILTHKSAKADYVMFLLNKSVVGAIYASILIQVPIWYSAVEKMLGPATEGPYEASWTISAIYTVAAVLAFDGALWLAHYIFHRVPFLWEFHKVHHSAEVMTPLTASRMHPVEEIFASLLSACSVGVVVALLDQYFGFGSRAFSLFGLNIIIFVFFIAAFNLRHSHVWLQYPDWVQHIFVSPAQHQIHHSKARQHWDKNMGFIFAFWDWSAGTLYSPKSKEDVEYGLGNGEDGTWNDPVALYFRPFKNAYALFKKNPRAAFRSSTDEAQSKQDAAPQNSAETN
ncbi:sterol desaturase family protein [Rhodobacteraceae bacterium B1Z28]|uniref:Sterol desaturase family protein n=1 Tax=Ruegeria haliotis TaxID=2747601 RepID=A0ABX2PPN3_9RHOB|nr:sterol desaturase family protein [Ruegeria haliotis]NVO55024.1 sterol desaturase family protein [Ruegeria haliotis]